VRAEIANYARAVVRYFALLSVRSGFLYSLIFHAVVIGVAVSEVSFLRRQPIAISRPIPIELVTIAQKTNIPKPKVAPKPKPKKEVVRKTAPKPVAKRADAIPLPTKPKSKQASKQEVAKVKPRLKPKPPQKKAEAPSFDIGRIAALINKEKEDQSAVEPKPDQPVVKKPPDRTTARSLDAPMTISEIDAVKMQIRRCWSLPAGASDAESLIVKVRLFLHRDGSLSRHPEIVDGERMMRPGEEYFRAAAESAVRAVLKCEPLRMPPKKYERWREMVLTFDPSEMLGG
jgi:hypothetical protein